MRRPQALLLDWQAPSADPTTLCRALRATAAGAGLFIVLLAAQEADPRAAEALEAGVDDLMAKSIAPCMLLSRLAAGLRARRRHEQLERDLQEMHRFAAELAVSNRKLQGAAATDEASRTWCAESPKTVSW